MSTFTLNEDTQEYTVSGPVSANDILDQAQLILWSGFTRASDEVLSSPDLVRLFLQIKLAGKEREVFACLFLDNRHRVIAFEELFYGTIDGAAVHPREVVKAALRHNAAAVVLSHNHPSGNPTPSEADRRITGRLKDALGLVDIRVLDHFVVTAQEAVSFAEQGLL